jgi:hypothetical protein
MKKVETLYRSLKKYLEEVKEALLNQDETIEAINKQYGIKSTKKTAESSGLFSKMSSGLSSSFGLGALKGASAKKSSRLLMGMNIGSTAGAPREPNIDPHKILSEILQMAMAKRKQSRALG